jgi:hypothetical protein
MRAGLCLAAAGLLVTGCATNGPTGNEVVAGALAFKKAGALCTEYRCSASYSIDGEPVGPSMPAGFVVCQP